VSVRAIKAGTVDFLSKPVNDADLVRAVRAAATGREMEKIGVDWLADLVRAAVRLGIVK
jgi:ActR/RegA family two-component response regulator